MDIERYEREWNEGFEASRKNKQSSVLASLGISRFFDAFNSPRSLAFRMGFDEGISHSRLFYKEALFKVFNDGKKLTWNEWAHVSEVYGVSRESARRLFKRIEESQQ